MLARRAWGWRTNDVKTAGIPQSRALDAGLHMASGYIEGLEMDVCIVAGEIIAMIDNGNAFCACS